MTPRDCPDPSKSTTQACVHWGMLPRLGDQGRVDSALQLPRLSQRKGPELGVGSGQELQSDWQPGALLDMDT